GRDATDPPPAAPDTRPVSQGAARALLRRPVLDTRARRAVATPRHAAQGGRTAGRARRRRDPREPCRDARQPPRRAPHRLADRARARVDRRLRPGRAVAPAGRIDAPAGRLPPGGGAGGAAAGPPPPGTAGGAPRAGA